MIIRDTVIVHTNQAVKILDTEKKIHITEDEQEIRTMIGKMHLSWQKLIENKDEQEILKYFAPSYIANQVSVYADNSGNIKSYTNHDFPKYLKSVIKRKGYSYEFSDVRFLDIEIKNDTYFNTVYKSKLLEKDENGSLKVNSVIITVTGKKLNGSWKIGNYSWVNFQYD